MRPSRLVLATVFAALSTSACFEYGTNGSFERPTTKTFNVRDGATVRIRVSGGSIRVTTGAPGLVEITLTARVRANSETEADRKAGDYDVVFQESGGDVTATARRKSSATGWTGFDSGGVSFKADLEVPPGVVLDLATSGGSITVRGDRAAGLRADTSGGSITVDGGAGPIALNTSGGSIRVGQALSDLTAHTSGGSISVDQVGAAARGIELDTSGGSIRVGVDPEASLRVLADTSGGRVSVEGLPLEHDNMQRNRVSGVVNGGRGALRAHTSGGSIEIRAGPAE